MVWIQGINGGLGGLASELDKRGIKIMAFVLVMELMAHREMTDRESQGYREERGSTDVNTRC